MSLASGDHFSVGEIRQLDLDRPAPIAGVEAAHDRMAQALARRDDRFSRLLSRAVRDERHGSVLMTMSGLTSVEHEELVRLTPAAHEDLRVELAATIARLRDLLMTGDPLFILAVVQDINLFVPWGEYYEPTHEGLETRLELVAGLLATQPVAVTSDRPTAEAVQAILSSLFRGGRRILQPTMSSWATLSPSPLLPAEALVPLWHHTANRVEARMSPVFDSRLRRDSIDVPSRGEEAYLELRRLVRSGHLAPRAIVREAAMARQLGMSRTPVREALRRLQAEDLVTPLTRGGYVVVELSPDELRNIYSVRKVLEGLAAHLAATEACRTDLAELTDLVETMEAAVNGQDDEKLAELNSQFHGAIARASGNAYLSGILANIQEIVERFRPSAITRRSRREIAHRQHQQLLAALLKRDPDGAEGIAQRHVDEALVTRLGSGRDVSSAESAESHAGIAPPPASQEMPGR